MKSEMKNTVMNHAVMKMARVKNNVIQNTTRENSMMKSTVLKNAAMKTAMMKNGAVERVAIKSAVMENAKNISCKHQSFLACVALSFLLLGCASDPDATCPLPQDGVCAALHTVDTAWDEKAKKEPSSHKKEVQTQRPKETRGENPNDEGVVWFFPNTKKRNAQIQAHHLIEVNHA